MKPHHWMLALLCGTLFATSSLAEGQTTKELPWYEIELIIFTRNLQPTSLNEAWPSNPGTPDVDNARALQAGSVETQSIETPEPYALLSEADFKLKTEFNRLRRSSSLKPEIHLAWRQPVTDKNSAQLLYLRTPFAIEAKTKIEKEVEAEIAAKAAVGTEIFTGFEIITKTESPDLEGTIRISVKRYLHVELDLLRHITSLPSFVPYEQSFNSALTEQSQTDSSYRMQAHRRMRSNELHYIDHPLMGVLIKITPYELPKPIPMESKEPEAVEPLNQTEEVDAEEAGKTAAKQEPTTVSQKPGTIRSNLEIPIKSAE